ncbi:MAG: response regulator [Spirochaetota bacterium]
MARTVTTLGYDPQFERVPTVMVVDDAPTNVKLLTKLLEPVGYTVDAHLRAHEALGRAIDAPPDIVLLDIAMPGMDGYEFCRRLKSEPRLRDTPVLFISAITDIRSRVRAFEAGGADYLQKPFHAEEVLARVNVHLSLRRQRESLLLLETAVQSMDDAILVVDRAGTLRYANSALERMTGYRATDLRSRNPLFTLHPGPQDGFTEAIWRTLLRGESWSGELIGVTADGRMYEEENSITPVVVEDTVAYVVALKHDVSHARETERRQARLRKDYEQFLGHELSNALTPILGHLGLALDSSTRLADSSTRANVEAALRSARHAKNLMVKLREIHRLEHGSAISQLREGSLHSVVRTAIASLSTEADREGITIVLDECETACIVMMDTDLLVGVFANLIRNAVEHVAVHGPGTRDGVRVSVVRDRARCVVTVANGGPPIPPDRLAGFFEKFNSNRTEKAGGLGLGTTYARIVTRAHGGEISVTSTEEEGTIVTVALPGIDEDAQA